MAGTVKLTAYLHTAITVRDLKRAQAFYEGVLGLQPVPRSLDFPGIWYEIGGVQIHLIVQPHAHPERPDPHRWGRNPHLALAVADLHQAERELIHAGYPVRKSTSGRAALFTQDPDGHILELNQA
ncbi:MAG: VOC family protein [Gloeomargarita sp. GMQP_bins_120]